MTTCEMTTPSSILIVDDLDQNRRLLQVLLHQEGYVTRTAAGGMEAMASIAEDPPDLILLDVMMPGMDGQQVARAVKADLRTRKIPIIMVTAQTGREARLAALDAGAEDFLSKPIDCAELWLRVRNLLRLKELGDQLETHQVSLEAEVAAGTELLEVAHDAIRSFTAIAAHDLRTPLTSIAGYSALLSEDWDTLTDQERRMFAAAIDRQSGNLTSLVEDIFASASIDDGGMSTSPQLIVLSSAIHRCLELGEGDTASVTVWCPHDLQVRADRSHLGRILDNYVQNALKYGKAPVRIEATQAGDSVQIRVRDNGPGVPPGFVPSLFSRFARADTAATRAEKGAGLGLSIVRGLAEVNGGSARYEPNVPNGSCFIAELPAGDSDSEKPAGAQDRPGVQGR